VNCSRSASYIEMLNVSACVVLIPSDVVKEVSFIDVDVDEKPSRESNLNVHRRLPVVPARDDGVAHDNQNMTAVNTASFTSKPDNGKPEENKFARQ